MKSRIIPMILFVFVLASTAQAAMSTSTMYMNYLSGVNHSPYVTASIKVTVDGSDLSFLVSNTSSATTAVITGLVFNVPDGITLMDVPANTAPWVLGKIGKNDLNSGLIKDYAAYPDAGLYTKKKFGAGDPNTGIAARTSRLFEFTMAGGSVQSGIKASDFDLFLARFQRVVYDGIVLDQGGTEGSDIATPTPIPGAVWLLGTGLLGMVGIRRFRRN